MNSFARWSKKVLPWLTATALPLASFAVAVDPEVAAAQAALPAFTAGTGGTVVHITGGNFGTASPTVNFKVGSANTAVTQSCSSLVSGTPGCIMSTTKSAITVSAPTEAAGSVATVSVDWPTGTTGGGTLTNAVDLTQHAVGATGVEFVYGPAITRFTPTVGTAGTVVHITGANLASSSLSSLPTVTFTSVPGGVPTSISTACAPTATPPVKTNCIVSHAAKSIGVKAPTSLTGLQQVSVTVDGVTTTDLTVGGALFDYGPAITSIGNQAGSKGTVIQIKGGHFGTATPTVTFSDSSLGPAVVSQPCGVSGTFDCIASHSDSTIVVKAPNGPDSTSLLSYSGITTLSVSTGGSSPKVMDDLTMHPPASSNTSALEFSYKAAITSISTEVGTTGTTVTIKGGNLQPSSGLPTVNFGSTAVNTTCVTLTSTGCIKSHGAGAIVVKAPPSLSGPQHVTVQVGSVTAEDLTLGGMNQTGSSKHVGAWFDYGPAITKVS